METKSPLFVICNFCIWIFSYIFLQKYLSLDIFVGKTTITQQLSESGSDYLKQVPRSTHGVNLFTKGNICISHIYRNCSTKNINQETQNLKWKTPNQGKTGLNQPNLLSTVYLRDYKRFFSRQHQRLAYIKNSQSQTAATRFGGYKLQYRRTSPKKGGTIDWRHQGSSQH